MSYRYTHAQNKQTRDLIRDGRIHNQLNQGLLTGSLRATVTVLTPLHVGTGDLMLINDLPAHNRPRSQPEIPLIAPFFRENNALNIPGSSLKGAFRHLYEAITASCLAQHSRRRHDRPDRNLSSCRVNLDGRRNDSSDVCPACRVFGAMGYMGQVFFKPSEISAQTEMQLAPERWTPEVDNDRERKIYDHRIDPEAELTEPLEVLPMGTEFLLAMDFRNIAAEELGLLLMIFGQDPAAPIYPKIGAAKAHGFGAVEIHGVQIEFTTQEDYLSFESMTIPTSDLDQYIQAGNRGSLLDTTAWGRIVSILGEKPEGF